MRARVVALTIATALVAFCLTTAVLALSDSTASITARRGAVPRIVPPSCPRTEPLVPSPHQRPGTAAAVVPGLPVRVVGCRYHGPGQRQPYGSLAQSRVLSAQALAIEINEGQVIPAGAYSSCAADPDDSYLMVFQYRDGSRLLVRIGVDGCIDATNGDRDVFQSNDLLLTLGTKFGHDKINTRSCGGDVSACMQQQDQTP